MAIDPPLPVDGDDDDFEDAVDSHGSLLQLSSPLSPSYSCSASPLPTTTIADPAQDQFNLNVIARDKVELILREAVEETVSAATSQYYDDDDVKEEEEEDVSDKEEEDEEDSVIEDNYNNLLVRCDEKVFCADKDIHHVSGAEGFPGNSLESLDGNNENGEEEDEEQGQMVDLSGPNILLNNHTTSDGISATDHSQGEEVNGLLSATLLSNNELNRAEIDASTGGNYLSRNSATTFHGNHLSDKDTAVAHHHHRILNSDITSCYNVIRDADGNSVTAVKGFGDSAGCTTPELVQMTPDILIKNISVTAEMGGIVSLSGHPTNPSSIDSHHHHRQFQQDSSVDGKRINCIVKCDSFAPDLLRNIQTAEQRGRHGEDSDSGSEVDNKLCLSRGAEMYPKNNTTTLNMEDDGDRRSHCNEDEHSVLGEENSISTATNGTTVFGKEAVNERQQKDCKDLPHSPTSRSLGHRRQLSPSSDTLGAETNNLNNNGIFRHSFTWEHEEQQQQKDALLSDSAGRRRDDMLTSDEDVILDSADKENNFDLVEEEEEEDVDRQQEHHHLHHHRHVSSDVMVAMFNGTLWNSSPIDIVGDFEAEIERELGLIAGGHRNAAASRSMLSNYPVAATGHGAVSTDTVGED